VTNGNRSSERLNCTSCDHFYVTWDPQFPRGCRAYEFKTKHMPSAVVLSTSGVACMKFTPKKRQGNVR
jgi:hypothetical protein